MLNLMDLQEEHWGKYAQYSRQNPDFYYEVKLTHMDDYTRVQILRGTQLREQNGDLHLYPLDSLMNEKMSKQDAEDFFWFFVNDPDSGLMETEL